MNEFLDANAFEPAARDYQRVIPDPIERVVPRFFHNLTAGDRFAGALLQGKVKGSATVLARFTINSTIGIAGLFDPARAMGLERQEEDIGQALERWGLTENPYLVLPFLGPTTSVELPDWVLSAMLPRWILGGYWHISLQALQLISTSAEALRRTEMIKQSAVDEYSFTLDAHLQRRTSLRKDGEGSLEDPFMAETGEDPFLAGTDEDEPEDGEQSGDDQAASHDER